MRIGVLMTCFNRRQKTLDCLVALHACGLPRDTSLAVFLVDDGSTDGTGEAVRSAFPAVTVLRGNGSLYWNGGMRCAFDAACSAGVDVMVWLNDDTVLLPGALRLLLDTYQSVRGQGRGEAIIVGATRDPSAEKTTYGGQSRRSGWKRSTFALVETACVPVECETMNGNCVLVPSAVFNAVGNLEAGFVHALGDLDYGLRARALGFTVWVAPGFVGVCSRNGTEGTLSDPSLPMPLRLRKLLSPKGLPLRAWRVFTRRHCGIAWPFFWLMPYARLLMSGTGLVRSPAATSESLSSRQGGA